MKKKKLPNKQGKKPKCKVTLDCYGTNDGMGKISLPWIYHSGSGLRWDTIGKW